MPGLSGLDVQQSVVSGGSERCIVFISATTDISISVQAMKAGAFTFLFKPVRLDELVAIVRTAVHRDALARASRGLRAA